MEAKRLGCLSIFNEEENIKRAVHFAEAIPTDMTSDYGSHTAQSDQRKARAGGSKRTGNCTQLVRAGELMPDIVRRFGRGTHLPPNKLHAS